METTSASPGSLAWEERPTRAIVRLSAPVVVSMLSYSAMTLVDTLFVGRLGAAALAGVGLGSLIAFGLACFSIGLLRSIKILVSQAAGAGRREAAPDVLGAGLVLALVLGLLTAVFGVLVAPLAASLAGGGAAGSAASSYLVVRVLGTPLVLAYTALRETRYGLGDSRSPMVASLAANVANVGLDALFLLVLDLGVVGAALATNVACLIEAGLIALSQRKDGFRFGAVRRYLRPLFSLGLPAGLQFLLEVGSFTLLGAMIARMGEMQMAAHQIAVQVLHFVFLPAFAIAEGASVLAGQAIGAGRRHLVVPVAVRAFGVAGSYAVICGAIFLAGGRWILSLFSADGALLAVAFQLLAVGAVMQVFDAANIVARGVLRGTSDVRIPALAGILTAWLATPPLAWFFGIHLGLGAVGGWIGLCVEILAGALFFWGRLWLRHRAPAPQLVPAPAA
ncbi:MATE family efflux transporter [Vulgatibacter sp.]|uniref:MATE family efflux transporter n=1 Tax=Vulgatibacter sp. TaxID=1971226 RepID=UPI003563A795